jgi:hypothetical protein
MVHAFFISGYPVHDDVKGNEVMTDLSIWLHSCDADGYTIGHESYVPCLNGDGTLYMSVCVRMEKKP